MSRNNFIGRCTYEIAIDKYENWYVHADMLSAYDR